MKYLFLLSFILFLSANTYSQSEFPSSILEKLESKLSSTEVEKIKTEYAHADESTKAVMLSVYSMPLSSKRELTDNYEKKKNEIIELKNTFEKMVPKGYVVFLELKESEYTPGMIQAIDLQVYKENALGELDMIDGDWDMIYGSDELDELLALVGWDRMTLLALKNIMQTANCISIQNGDYAEIGFARSGLGKYFYRLYSKKLSKPQISELNDGCEFIYYKDNVVLRYVGGMAGPQCFVD